MKAYNTELKDRHFISIRLSGRKKAQTVYNDLINNYPAIKDITELHEKEILIEIIQEHDYCFSVRDLKEKYPDTKIDGFAYDETARNNRRWYRLWRNRRF